jgi:hypothetical protein
MKAMVMEITVALEHDASAIFMHKERKSTTPDTDNFT